MLGTAAATDNAATPGATIAKDAGIFLGNEIAPVAAQILSEVIHEETTDQGEISKDNPELAALFNSGLRRDRGEKPLHSDDAGGTRNPDQASESPGPGA